MASCWVFSGLGLLSLSFIGSAITFIAPYWLEQSNPAMTEGLWGFCRPGGCTWFFDNNFRWEKQQPDWFKACQALSGVGILTILIAFITACIHLCCRCCRATASGTNAICGLLFLAFLELGVSIGLYGYMSYKEKEANMSGNMRYTWAFWLGVSGTALTLLSALLYSCEGCRGHSHEGYARGEVI